MRRLGVCAVLIGIAAAACGAVGAGPGSGLAVGTVVSTLTQPWDMAFAPDGRLFITERANPSIRVWQNNALGSLTPAVSDLSALGEGGMLGIALHPSFGANGWLYVYYTYNPGGGQRNKVVRFTESGGTLGGATTIIENIPGANIHDGGRIRFGPDGKLYVTTGDASNSSLAPNTGSLAGKILRLNGDGTIPSDNPFAGSAVYSYGHRNPQGLDWHPQTGRLYATEHGPSSSPPNCCHDEVNLIEAGRNYGWPAFLCPNGDATRVAAVMCSGDTTWAPSGATFYRGTLLPWTNSYLFAALRGEALHRAAFGGADGRQVTQHEVLLQNSFGRLRVAVEGPDGAVYLLTANGSGDRLLRVAPAP